MSGSPQWSLSLRLPHQNSVHTSPIRNTCPAHLILLDFTTRTILGQHPIHHSKMKILCIVADYITISYSRLPRKIILHFHSLYCKALHIHRNTSPTTKAYRHPNETDLK
jgi:hypothetical protein